MQSVMKIIAVAIPVVLATRSVFGSEKGYYLQPAIHDDQVVFVSEGDLWSANLANPREDGSIVAWRLTSSDGFESHPHISPDGTSIAFSAEYDGNVDVYVMPIDGGVPQRLTYHPAPDTCLAWMPDGSEILFRSSRKEPNERDELWRVPARGGMPDPFAFGECSMISVTPTGGRFAFTPWSNEDWDWKGYRGGTAPDIWLGDFNSGHFSQLTDDSANDMFPMWVRGRVYFLSDRAGAPNIFSMAASGDDLQQHTFFAPDPENPTTVEGYDLRWPSADTQRRGDHIVFSQGGDLALLDVEKNEVRRLDLRTASDRVAVRQRFADVEDAVTEFELSPDGSLLLVGARGELISVPIEGGTPKQLTRTSFAREWGGAFLDDEYVVLISDAAGEQQLAVGPIDGSEPPSLITEDRQAWLFPPVASPDGEHLAFADKTMRLHLIEMRTLVQRQIDQSQGTEITDYRFSPDGQWLAYTKPLPNKLGAIYLYSVRTGRTFPVSDGMHDDSEPRWDPAGEYLYFLSKRHLDAQMGDLDFEHVYLDTTRVYAVPLAHDMPPPLTQLALAADFDLEDWAEPFYDDDDYDDYDDDEEDDQDDEPEMMRVDTEGLAKRHYVLPIPPGNYSDLEAVPGALFYLAHPNAGLLDDDFGEAGPSESESQLRRYLFLDEQVEVVAEHVHEYRVNLDCTVAAVAHEDGLAVFDLESDESFDLDLEELQLPVDVRAEWGHILQEAWRLQRDFYWSPDMGGVDWPAMLVKYEALLPRVGTRQELNDLIGEMIGELGTSHTYVWGGDAHDQAETVDVGMLGADVRFDGRGFVIRRILPGRPWDEELHSPLGAPHLDVKEGNYILAVNDIPLTPGSNLYAMLQDQAYKTVKLTVADDAFGANRRDVKIVTVPSEWALYYDAWIENNRRHVDEVSEGALGYLHIPDMDGEGLAAFSRGFYPQAEKQGLIIDVRNNDGGFVSQMVIDRLAQRPWAYDQPRHGSPERYPYRSPLGHMAVLIDQHAGSDGDIFPSSFRTLGLGPLIGTRTWGGVIGIRADKPFVDLGFSTQPEYAWWDDSGWSLENEGVEPDIEVQITPQDRASGLDPQLAKAIEVLMEQIAAEPPAAPAPPPSHGQ
jgi:tricorn protease